MHWIVKPQIALVLILPAVYEEKNTFKWTYRYTYFEVKFKFSQNPSHALVSTEGVLVNT